jgi:hypothetical protein
MFASAASQVIRLWPAVRQTCFNNTGALLHVCCACTLQGSMSSPDLQGIVPRAVQAIGEGIAADTSGAEYEVRC